MKRNLILVSLVVLCITVSQTHAAFYEVYGRLNMNVDTTDNNRRNWAMVIKLGDVTAGKYLTCFPSDKSTWPALIAAYNYPVLINLNRTDGQDDFYIDNPPDADGYKAALVQLINNTHKIARYLQDLGHQVRIYYAPIPTIDYLKRANDIPIGVRISTSAFDIARSNKLAANEILIRQDCGSGSLEPASDCVIKVIGSTCTNGYVSYSDGVNNPNIIRVVDGHPIIVSNEVDFHRWIGRFTKGLYAIQVYYPQVPEHLTEASYFLWINGVMKTIRTLDQNANLPNTWHQIGYLELINDAEVTVSLAKQTIDPYYVVFDAVKFVKMK
jgi:hypothetical protein